MSTRIQRIQNAVEKLYNCHAIHEDSVPVREEYEGKAVWEGVVEVFNVDHPKAQWCYAWEIPGPEPDWAAVLNIPPATDPVNAVRAYIVSQSKTPGV
jgi:hypothetical protein